MFWSLESVFILGHFFDVVIRCLVPVNHRTVILHKKRARVQIVILLFQYISSHVSVLTSAHSLLYTRYLLTIALPVNSY